MVRSAVFHALGAAALTFFGCEVCPYVHSLGRYTLAVLLAAFFSASFAVRWPLQARLVLNRPPLDRPRAQFWLELQLFAAVGVAITVYDRLVYGFPVSSGLRVLVGCITIGLFAAIDAALFRERAVLSELSGSPSHSAVARYSLSLSRKFVLVGVSILLLLCADLFLLSMQDLTAAAARSVTAAGGELMIETGVTLALLLALTVNSIVGFARNLRMLLDNQNRVLDEVARGKLDVSVPVASNDEFGVIAAHTNTMISGLRDRVRVRETFGKLVSPAVAEKLLQSDAVRLGGERRSLVVLFSDVRNFTARTERANPEVIVSDLNQYFTRMVDVVHAHAGVIDKFIGDGLMAVFGLEEPERAADDAVLAAVSMHRALVELNGRLVEPMAIGIGIHAGEVVAGTIGSPQRYEFTFIGDPVNCAARIEGLTKELDCALLMSESVWGAISAQPRKWPWRTLGEHPVRGKEALVRLFGLSADEAVSLAAPAGAPRAPAGAVTGISPRA